MKYFGFNNTSQTVSDVAIVAGLAEANAFLLEFAKFWPEGVGWQFSMTGTDCPINIVQHVPPNGVGDVAYHNVVSGEPECWVFADNLTSDLWCAIMHEALERLVNPTMMRFAPDGRLMEVSDPVNANFSNNYPGFKSLLMPNFVTPPYFGTAMPNVAYDYLGILKGPADIAGGGYQLRLDPSRSRWLTTYGMAATPHVLGTRASFITRPMPHESFQRWLDLKLFGSAPSAEA